MITLQERVHSAPKPTDWQLDKVHQVFRIRRGNKNNGMKEDNLLSLSYGRIIQKDIETADGLLPENFEGYQIVEPGNIVLRLTDLQNDKRSLRQGLVTQRGIITSAYDAVEVQRDNDPRFWFYTLLALDLAKHYYSLGGGVRQSVKFGDFPNDWVYRPDLATQRAIANFLDRETARIDLLIEKKQRLVELLGEKAKTKKLDLVTGQQRGEQKETSILWAPSIPRHWEERAVWMLFELGRGRVMSHEYIAENEGEYPIYSSQTANDGVMGCINTYDFEGDYLTWTTDGAKAGTVFRRRGKFNCTNVCGTLRPLTRSIDLNYAQVALDTATDFFVRHDINPKLMNGVMSKIRIPYPPLDEQRKTGNAIDQIEQSFKPIREKSKTSIDRLKEYRSALITAAVTGRIDVTTYAKSGTPDRRLDVIQKEMET